MPVRSAAQIAPDFPAIIRMAQISLHDKLLNVQQEAISSFIEFLEKEISQHSWCVQSLMDQCSNNLPRSIQEQVKELIKMNNKMSLGFRGWRNYRGNLRDCGGTVSQVRGGKVEPDDLTDL